MEQYDELNKYYGHQKQMPMIQPSIKPTQPINPVGYTKVWEGKPTEFIRAIKEWSFIKEDYLKTESAANHSNIVLWVANEWIDWAYLRACDEYRPANTNNYRSNSAIERC